ncbi:MAG: IclR family transcriptional regulator [Pseudomonadota bacterium]
MAATDQAETAESGTVEGGTVGKALDVLDQVAAFGRPVRFSELLSESPYPKATLYRFVQTLTGLGMLSYDPERQLYGLGLRLVRLAHGAWQQSSLAPIARTSVEHLAEKVGETVHLAQLDAAQVLYVDKRNAAKPNEVYSSAGKVGPAYCTAVGKAMLAFLPDAERRPILEQQSFHRFTPATIIDRRGLDAELATIRGTGYALDRQEHEPGNICIAAPIQTAGGWVLGAISVTASIERMTLHDLEATAPDVVAAASAIAQSAAAWRFPVSGEISETEKAAECRV